MRGDASFNITSQLNATQIIPSDSLITYSICPAGSLTLVGNKAAGGSSPRQFSLNAHGDKVAVGVQDNGWVVVYDRDTETGEIGDQLGVVGGLGATGVVCTIWDEI